MSVRQDIYDSGGLSGHTVHYEPHPHGVQHPTVPQHKGPWHFDEINEASMLGLHFAQAVAIMSTGRLKDVIKANASKPVKKVFFEETKYNPALQNTHIAHEYDAHYIEQEKHWNKKGSQFARASREYLVPQPKQHIKKGPDRELGTKVFGRNRDILPFTKRKKLLTQTMNHDISQVRAQQLRTSTIGPTTYKIPDPWVEKLKPVCGLVQESSVFKSRTTRFGDQRSTADSPSRRSCSPPPEISIIHHSPSLAHSSSLPPIPVMVGSELAEQSSGGVESWNSLAFDKVGDVEVTNANININANYHRPRTAPDLIITQLRPNSPDIQDPFHRPPSPSTFNERSLSRSAEITRSHTPGYTFGSRSPIKEYSLASSSLETGNQVHLFAQDLSVVAKTFDPPKSAPPNLGSQRRGRAGAGAGAPSFQSSFNDTLNDSLITDATTNATPAEEEAHHPRRSSLSSANAQSTAAFSALSNATPSYHRTLLARVNPPLCYSKKPLFETILQQHREKREQKLAQQMEQREIIKEILNSSSSPTLPDLTQKPSTTGVLTRPQISSIELNMSSGGMQSRQLPARPHTTGGR